MSRMDFEDIMCGCGCWRLEHTDEGYCPYCTECEGFEYDELGTNVAYAMMGESEFYVSDNVTEGDAGNE